MEGETISHYQVLEHLGGGGMGVVYRARDLKLKRLVALKVLPPDLTRDAEAKERFMQEAQAASSLDHHNICTIYEIDEAGDGRLFMVMALYDGETLRDRLRRGPLSIDQALDIGLQLAQGLGKAHAAGIVHRDVKPANLIVTTDGVLKILDFGIAKLIGQTGMTGAGTTLGTVAYMSPEQTRGESVDERTDLWAAGAVLYEAISGQPPFGGEVAVAVATAIQQREPVPLTSLRSGVPLDVERLVGRALTKARDERFQTAADFAAEVRRIRRDFDRSGRPTLTGANAQPAPASANPSIVVLPFANTGGDPENEFFSDGITEEIINALTRVPSIDVVARTSAFAFKGKNADVRTIGRELGVGAVLEGSVRKFGKRLRVTVQLINVADGFHLWSDRFDREVEDIFAIQDEISGTITRTLTERLAPAPPPARPTDDVDAYTLYLKGRYHWNRRTNESMRMAAGLFEEALANDPDFALAHAGLADCYTLLGWVAFGGLAPHEAFPKARASARRALELDPSLAEAHNSLGWTQLVYDWDWAGADRSFTRALDVSPRYAMGHAWYAMHLAWTGRMEAGLEHAVRAQELDPLSLIIHTLAGWVFYFAKRYDESIEHCRKTLELDPGYVRAHLGLGWAYQQQGKLDMAKAEFARGAELSRRSPRYVAALGAIHAIDGHVAEARAAIAELDAMSERMYISPADRAVVFAALGQADETFANLERAYEERSGALVYMRLDPDFASVSKDPRFADLVRRMRFPD
jgi:serine/threonine-protein kinase